MATILYPKAVSHLDRYMVCRVSDNAIVEGHFNHETATAAARYMDGHNERNGHAERYVVKPRSDFPELS